MYKLSSSREHELEFEPANQTAFSVKMLGTVFFLIALVINISDLYTYYSITGEILGDANSIIVTLLCIVLFLTCLGMSIFHKNCYYIFRKNPDLFELRTVGTFIKKAETEETISLSGLKDIRPKNFLSRMYQDTDAGSVDVSYEIYISLIFSHGPETLLSVYYLSDNHTKVEKQRAELLKKINRFILQLKKFYNLSDLSDKDYEEITITQKDLAIEEDRYISL